MNPPDPADTPPDVNGPRRAAADRLPRGQMEPR
ncbi:hypothetical protein JOF41_001758 [Saccharothrix coeruleofusca]|nr:hypothetical protein [Saccharothrix coeruleofusca]